MKRKHKIIESVEYTYGDVVIAIVDPEQGEYMVTGYLISNNNVFYECRKSGEVAYLLGIEITKAINRNPTVTGFRREN